MRSIPRTAAVVLELPRKSAHDVPAADSSHKNPIPKHRGFLDLSFSEYATGIFYGRRNVKTDYLSGGDFHHIQ